MDYTAGCSHTSETPSSGECYYLSGRAGIDAWAARARPRGGRPAKDGRFHPPAEERLELYEDLKALGVNLSKLAKNLGLRGTSDLQPKLAGRVRWTEEEWRAANRAVGREVE